MKKLIFSSRFLVVFFLVMFSFIMSVDSFSQTFSLKAGLNLSKMFIHDNGTTYSSDFAVKPGFHAGIMYNFEIGKTLASETGIILSTKGYKNSVILDLYGAKETISKTLNLFYIVIPYTAKVYFGKGNTKIFGFFGPYLGIGLCGSGHYEQDLNGHLSSGTTRIKWGTKDGSDLRRFDFGLSVGAGLKIKSIELGISYDYGLSNITAATLNLSGSDIGNRVFGISVLYPLFRIPKTSE